MDELRPYTKSPTNFSLSPRSSPEPWVANDDKLKFVGLFLQKERAQRISLRRAPAFLFLPHVY